MSGQEEYRRFCEEVSGLPLMMTSSWMDVICGEDGWDAVVRNDESGVVTAMPFEMKTKLGLTKLRTPAFTAHSGPWMRSSEKEGDTARQGEYITRVQQMLEHLPKGDFCLFKLDASFLDVQPWLWQHFDARPQYTYRLDLGNGQNREAAMNRTLRKHFNKEIDGLLIDVEATDVISFMRKYHPYWTAGLERWTAGLLDQDLIVVEAVALYEMGKCTAMLVAVEDEDRVYFLTSASIKDEGQPFSFYDLIYLYMDDLEEGKIVDFMGSQDPNLAHVFRAMGARPELFFVVSRAQNPLLKWAH